MSMWQTAQHLVHRVGIAVVECGFRSESGPHSEDILVVFVLSHNLVNEELTLRTRSDKRHITTEDIPQLWQLVEMMLAKEAFRRGGVGGIALATGCRAHSLQ